MKKTISFLLVVGIFVNLLCTNITNAQTTVEQMLENMTTEQKIAQMLMPAFRQYEGESVTTMNLRIEEILKKYGFGGVILFAENNASTEQTVKLIDSMQKANATVDGRAQLLIAVDQEGARVVRLASGTQGPGNMGLGATGDETNAYEMGEIIGAELSKIGYNVNFAPVVDVNNNPSNPVIGVRSFSDDAATVSRFANSYINGLSKQNVVASLKHFPGHGDTATDSHTGLPRIEKTYDELKENELIPFKGCIKDGAEMIMTAHIQYPKIETETYTSIKDGSAIELPATLSKTIITDILRGDLNYDGVVVTDAMNMSAIAQNFSVLDSAKLAINAGVDIILMPIDTATKSGIDALDQFIVDVANLVDTGDISIENVNKAVTRILTLKENHGLLSQYSLDDLQAKIDAANGFVGSKANHDKEWEIAKKSITLVKNNGMLPIKENEKTVVVVQYANEILSAEYAIDRLKNENIIDEDMDVTVFLMNGKEMSEIQTAIQDAKNVLVFTEQGSASALTGEAYKNFDKMIEYVHAKGNKISFISCNQPYDVARLQGADALLLSWSPKGMDEKPNFSNGTVKTYGVGMPVGVYMAFGKDTEVTGKLPLNIPTLNDEYKYTDELLYERGYGLKYEKAKSTSSGRKSTSRSNTISILENVDDWAKEEIAKANEKGLIPETFAKKDATKAISRLDFAAVAVKLYEAISGQKAVSSSSNPFTDTNDDYVLKAYALGITKGVSNTEFGNGTITREQMATMIDRTLKVTGVDLKVDISIVTKFADDNEMHDWGRPSIYAMTKEEIIKGIGDNRFNPLGEVKVEEVLAIALRCVEVFAK